MQWGPPMPPPESKEPDGVTTEGIPLSSRGGFLLDTASFASGDEGVGAVSLFLGASIPIQGKTFLDARVPVAFVSQPIMIGNVGVGAHHVFRLGKGAWYTLGGSIGLPTAREDVVRSPIPELALSPRALWDLGDYFPDTVPVKLDNKVEGHIGIVTLRGFVDLVVVLGHGSNYQQEFAIPHAFEVQVGHEIGGGLRIQGVAIPTGDDLDVVEDFEGDLYQLAFEPFFTYEGKLMFVRTGIVLPVDAELGPPFAQTWGFKLATGVRID
jgi:hypothetical protein